MDLGEVGKDVLVGVVTAAVTGPLAWFGGIVRERARARRPLAVHVEKDTAIIFGTIPDWASFPYYFDCDPEQLPANPPDLGVEWWSWATENHALPAVHSEINVTLMPRTASTLVVDGLRVKLIDVLPAPRGCLVVHPVGGADIVHRQASIEFIGGMAPIVSFLEAGSADRRRAFTFAVAEGEVAQLSITSHVVENGYLYRWTALLDFIVNGMRRTVEISNNGRPFVLHGGANCEKFEWTDDGWRSSNYYPRGESLSGA